jgi:hypothetical protein
MVNSGPGNLRPDSRMRENQGSCSSWNAGFSRHGHELAPWRHLVQALLPAEPAFQDEQYLGTRKN